MKRLKSVIAYFITLSSFGWWKCDGEAANLNSVLSILFNADLNLRCNIQLFNYQLDVNLQVD